MGCPTLRDCLVWSLFASTILYAFVAISFKYSWDQQCVGDWGNRNPPLAEKNGRGRCSLGFDFKFVPANKTLLNWESSYVGEWKMGAKDGEGVYTSLSGLEYSGEWRKDQRHGFGAMKLTDGTVYQGTWKQDKFTGDNNTMILGKYKRKSEIFDSPLFNISDSIFEGQVIDGMMDGNGSIAFPSKKEDPSVQRGVVVGEFSNGLFQKGHFVLSNGNSAKTVSFENSWDFGTYKGRGELQIEIFGKEGKTITKSCEWDGTALRVKEDNLTIEPQDYLLENTTYSSGEERSMKRTFCELNDLLHHLKWFQFHFLYSRVALDLEAYTFEKVDAIPTPEPKVELKEL